MYEAPRCILAWVSLFCIQCLNYRAVVDEHGMLKEYNNLPLRFSRQLSLDQMNEAVDYINAVVERKHTDRRRSSGSAGGCPSVVRRPSHVACQKVSSESTTTV